MATSVTVYDAAEMGARRPPVNATGTSAEIRVESDLAAKTVLLRVKFGMLGNSRKVKEEVLTTDADKGLLNVSKTLLDSAELDAIRKADGQMRAWIYNSCLPFEMGISLLPTGMVQTAWDKLKEYKAERTLLVDTFIAAYPSLCASAAEHLGSLYNVADYPAIEEIRAKFDFDWQMVSFGVPLQLRDINPELYEAEVDKARQQIQTATEEITALMRQNLFDMVSHLQDKLTPAADGKQRILRETAVKNVQDFLATFDIRNVTDDVELAEQVAKLKGLMDGKSATTIRSSDKFREELREGMEGITATLSEMVEEKAGRMFRSDD